MIKIQVPISKGIESLFGTHDENIRSFESALAVHIHLLEDSIQIEGKPECVRQAEVLLSEYESLLEEGHQFSNGDVKDFLRVVKQAPDISLRRLVETSRKRTFGRKSLSPRSPNQMLYFEAIDRCDMVFGIGPAGTGKTYLAVAMAVSNLMAKKVSRIVLARPAVEAGESLGFLPGTIQQKVDPYLRPLYDALYDMLDSEKVEKLIEKGAT